LSGASGRNRTIRSASAAAVARGVRAEAKKAFAVLRAGLGDYARKPS
jgi:hypothetical protein